MRYLLRKERPMNNIIEGNKLIAKFLWGKQGNPEDREPEWYTGEDLPYCDEDKYYQNVGAMVPITLEIMQFNSSWDWLMPVVEKIESIREDTNWQFTQEAYVVIIQMGGCTIESVLNNPDLAPRKYQNTVWANNKLLSTWTAVVEFIKWYNTQNQ